jgi:hypothetical protein
VVGLRSTRVASHCGAHFPTVSRIPRGST